MVGIFSRFSVRGNHRRTQSSVDEAEVLPPNSEAINTNTVAVVGGGSSHGIETTVDQFKPVEHPTEPLDYDQPIQCPLPEPSILNDGRIWKERVSSGVQRRIPDIPDPITQDHSHVEPETPRARPRPPNRGILPSASAPEHNILKLLEECNASGISFHT